MGFNITDSLYIASLFSAYSLGKFGNSKGIFYQYGLLMFQVSRVSWCIGCETHNRDLRYLRAIRN